jgi:NADH-quinone oxidoreductase subunit N
MVKKMSAGVSSVVLLNSFTVFPEYFISTSVIYILIVSTILTYNVYGLIMQKALSNCIGLILIMACYLIINDDLMTLKLLSFNGSVSNDYLSFFSKLIVCFFSAIYFFLIAESIKEQRLISFEYLIILLFAVLGLLLLCSSNDLLTAYLAIELTSLSSYILASFKKTSSYSIEAGVKYFVVGSLSSALILLGISFIYFFSGSININDFSELFTDLHDMENCNVAFWSFYLYPDNQAIIGENPAVLDLGFWMLAWAQFGLFVPYITEVFAFTKGFGSTDFSFLEYGLTLVIFGLFIKLALAPFHSWSLDVYEGSPNSSTFFFAVITKLSIFIFLIRLCYFGMSELYSCWQFYSLWVGLISVLIGSLGGLKQRKIKTLLAYSSTSNMGYVLLAFGAHDLLGIQMVLFYMVIYMTAGVCVWFIFSMVQLKANINDFKYNKELGDFSLLRKSNPAIAFALAVALFSMAGIPPFIGFFVKMSVFSLLVSSAFDHIALMGVLCSVISTFYYIRIIKVLYYENTLTGKLYIPINTDKSIVIAAAVFSMFFLFTNPTLLYLVTYKVSLMSAYSNLNLSDQVLHSPSSTEIPLINFG